jgi:glycosyltransferase involved in cell wall biosynthesis
MISPALLLVPQRSQTSYFLHVDGSRRSVKGYAAAHVFLSLSQVDSFPTVIVEPEACGTDAVTYHVGGCKEGISPASGALPLRATRSRGQASMTC